MSAIPTNARLHVLFRLDGTLLRAEGPLADRARALAADAGDAADLVRALVEALVAGDACAWAEPQTREALVRTVLSEPAVHETAAVVRHEGLRLLTLVVDAAPDGARLLALGEGPVPAGLSASPIPGVDLLQDIIDAVPATISIKDAERRYVFVNRAWERFYGVERAKLLGNRFEALLPGGVVAETFADHSSHVELRDTEVLETGQAVPDQEEYIVDRNGRERTLLSTKLPLADAEGRSRGVLSVTHDITARKEQELALGQAKAEAEAADRGKSEFLGMVTQETRAPLAELLAAVARCRAGPPALAGSEDLAIVARCSEQLRRLFDDLLDLSVIGLGNAVIQPGPTDPRATIEAAIATVRPDLAAKGLALDVEIAERVPALVIIDKTRVRYVLSRLLDNACRFTVEGGITVSCALDPGEDGSASSLVFAVTDTGIGIPADRHAYIFAPFTRLEGEAVSGERGAGLGLAIASRLVTAMGGAIGVDSPETGGSRFWFTVPAGSWQPSGRLSAD